MSASDMPDPAMPVVPELSITIVVDVAAVLADDGSSGALVGHAAAAVAPTSAAPPAPAATMPMNTRRSTPGRSLGSSASAFVALSMSATSSSFPDHWPRY
ncbi:MAG: hypothetical protein JNK12_03230 [Acidimicrobiales bacterium]|nr:hypothetical protein [Acidimicrobiales bacterium]